MEQIEDFCEKLVILSQGKSNSIWVLKRYKKLNIRKKNILLRGNSLPLDEIKKIKGVISFSEHRRRVLS